MLGALGLLTFASATPAVLAAGIDSANDACRAAAPGLVQGQGATRVVDTRDLATLADIGQPSPYPTASPLEASPDGKLVAFVVSRANPDQNNYCQRLMVARTDGRGAAIEIDRGSYLIRDSLDLYGWQLNAGWSALITPHWSPDGRMIAYLKRWHGSTQIWTVDVASHAARRSTSLASDILDFAWARDGRSFITKSQPALARQAREIEQEGRGGYLFDDRYGQSFASRPLPVGPVPDVFERVSVDGATVSPATPGEAASLDRSEDRTHPVVSSTGGLEHRAWTEPQDKAHWRSDQMLVRTSEGGRRDECRETMCTKVRGIWWSADAKTLYFRSNVGWAGAQTGLFRWEVGWRRPKSIVVTDDLLIGCRLVGAQFLCARESATKPRYIAAIDLRSGRSRVLYDPNSSFDALRLGSVRRLTFRNSFGIECYADLVLPPDHRAGQHHPLVVVQYTSLGFLRGGTNDEVPIQALAGAGFAVLSFQRPMLFEVLGRTSRDELETEQREQVEWRDRRSVQSALEKAVAAALATNTVDPARLGITGVSDGQLTAQWALINSNLFKVAAIGGCCEDRSAMILYGTREQDMMRQLGRPAFDDPSSLTFWRPVSIALNAARFDVPLLVQAVDSEYIAGMETIDALRSRGKPIEVRVFPDEVHYIWQPVHRLAMYDRFVDWFRFWLMDRMNCTPSLRSDMARWLAMKLPSDRSAMRCADDRMPMPDPGLGIR